MASLAPPSLRVRKKTLVALFAFVAVFSLLFQYRILSLLKRLGADVTPLGTKLPISFDLQSTPIWLVPIYSTMDYLNTVWFTTLLGLLLAGAVVTFLPGFINARLRGNGWGQHLVGVLLGIPNMLCTCCAATALPGFRKTGAGLGPSLAFFVTAPTLNIVVIFLAFQVLPFDLAVARTLLGLIAAACVTYVVANLNTGLSLEPAIPACDLQEDRAVSDLLWTWLTYTWRTAKTVIPLLIAGILIISILKAFLPFEVVAKHLGNDLPSTLIASVAGTLLMVPTFTEVLWVGEFTKQGMGIGPAVALLVTLPAVSFPSLWVLGKVFRSYRLALSLGLAILALGIVGGMAFQLV